MFKDNILKLCYDMYCNDLVYGFDLQASHEHKFIIDGHHIDLEIHNVMDASTGFLIPMFTLRQKSDTSANVMRMTDKSLYSKNGSTERAINLELPNQNLTEYLTAQGFTIDEIVIVKSIYFTITKYIERQDNT